MSPCADETSLPGRLWHAMSLVITDEARITVSSSYPVLVGAKESQNLEGWRKQPTRKARQILMAHSTLA